MRSVVICTIIALLTGCSANISRNTVEVVRTSGVSVDGKLDDAVWQHAPHYSFQIFVDPTNALMTKKITEKSSVQFAIDDEFLYAGYSLEDGDVVQENEKDQQHHYTSGDVVELFLKPVGHEWFWEFFATPGGHKTGIFFPSRGRRGLDSNFAYHTRIRVAASVQGTMNELTDRDHGWTAEVAIPLAELSFRSVPFGASEWTVLAARYNYGCGLEAPEVSSYPQAVRVNFHAYENYAHVKIVDPPHP